MELLLFKKSLSELIEHYYFNNKKCSSHEILLYNILHISLKTDRNHFQNKNLYHSINQLIFCIQNLGDFKYISYNLFENEKIT